MQLIIHNYHIYVQSQKLPAVNAKPLDDQPAAIRVGAGVSTSDRKVQSAKWDRGSGEAGSKPAHKEGFS